MTLMRLLAVALIAAMPMAAHAETIPLGLTSVTFTDTSGELRDQTPDHDRRLAAFIETLKAELAKGGKFEMAEVACADDQCRPQETVAKAKAEGSRYVVFCGLQKTSSLVLWARVDVVDSTTSKVVLTRLITFRGDTDESWFRTARFIGRAINGGFGA